MLVRISARRQIVIIADLRHPLDRSGRMAGHSYEAKRRFLRVMFQDPEPDSVFVCEPPAVVTIVTGDLRGRNNALLSRTARADRDILFTHEATRVSCGFVSGPGSGGGGGSGCGARPDRAAVHREGLAAIQPHADDIPIFAGGTVLKLMNEGYTGYLIRTTNDDMAGRGTIAETALVERTRRGRTRQGDGVQARLQSQLRKPRDGWRVETGAAVASHISVPAAKVDTIVCYDPWGTTRKIPTITLRRNAWKRRAGWRHGTRTIRNSSRPD